MLLCRMITEMDKARCILWCAAAVDCHDTENFRMTIPKDQELTIA